MKILKFFFIFWAIFFSIKISAEFREIVIEDFESGSCTLLSYPGEDMEPDAWTLDTNNTPNQNSDYSLKIFGNSWKIEEIEPTMIDSNDVWQISEYIEDKGEIHGFGLSDGNNELLYSLDGEEELNIEEWVVAYQGAFPEGEWVNFQLPVADDWMARFDYLPTVTEIIFLNDNDASYGVVYFDNVINITEDLPVAPIVNISYSIGRVQKNSKGERNVNVQFDCEITDPDSDQHTFNWNFGDGNSSNIQNPLHNFIIEDDHAYTVHLDVLDETELFGFASCQIEVDEGTSSFPLTINFVGDIMLGRHYEDPGGIIPVQGVETIFEPTLSILGEDADISVANLECPLTTHYVHHPTKTIYFKGDPDNAAGLSYAGIDLVCLANNHVIDYMLEGMQETKQTLDDYDILYSGAGANSYEAYQPLFYSKKGVSLSFLRSSDRTGQYNNYQPYLQAGYNKFGFAYMTPYYVREQIQEVKDVSDLVIVETHSGSEYSTAPGANYDFADVFAGWDEKDFSQDEDYTPRIDVPHMWDVEIRHFFIDSGADIVICHHPHVIQGVEMYNGKLIAHSLGNFIFDLSYFETFPTMTLKAKIDERGFYEYSIKPAFIDDYIPQIAEGELGNYILDYIAMKSKEMNTYLYVDRENVEAFVITDTLTMNTRTEHYERQLYFEQIDDHYVSQVIQLPKNGNISSIDHILPFGNYEYRVGRELVWFGNYEDEGASMWNINSSNEWFDDNTFYEGERSLCIHQNDYNGYNIITNMENRMIKRSDGKYSVHGYIKTENAEDVTVQARFYQSRTSGYMLGLDNLDLINGDTDWHYYYRELDIPGNTNFIDVVANSECPNSGEGYAWFDNTGLIEWEAWEEINYASADVLNPNDYYYLQIRSEEPLERGSVEFTETNYSEHLVSSKPNDIPSPDQAHLYQNYPNPFNPAAAGAGRSLTTTIAFSTNQDNVLDTRIEVYNIRGQKVKVLVPSESNTISKVGKNKKYFTNWDGTDENNHTVASGIYLINLKINGKSVDTIKGVLIK